MSLRDIIEISKEHVSACLICGEKERRNLYKGLEDRLFGAPGKWKFDCCVACGCAYMNPRPTLSDIDKAYTKTYAERKTIAEPKSLTFLKRLKRAIGMGFLANSYGYVKGVKFWQRVLVLPVYLSPYWYEQLSFRVMRLPYKPGGRLLDVGCGIGDFLVQMSNLGWKTEGLDTDPKVLQICRERGLSVKEGTLESQNYPENSFDAITLKHVIEHVHDPLNLLKECGRILKPGGNLVVLTPNLQSIGHKLFKDSWIGLDPPRHLVLFTFESLFMAVQKAGLKVVTLSSTARPTRFNWRVSFEIKSQDQTSYMIRTSMNSWFVESVSDKVVRLMLIWDKRAGDELALISTK